MENARNYQRELDNLMSDEANRGKRVLIHACCAPCSSYCLLYLRPFFRVTVYYYNPNITEHPEYLKRVEEEKRLIAEYNKLNDGAFPIEYIDGNYEPEAFFEAVKGLEKEPEGGERCKKCFYLRLKSAGEVAKERDFDYFATTLTLSPLKNTNTLNIIGEQVAKEVGIDWLPSDFKKKDGYKRSIELSKEYDLYRQDFCGCGFSKAERARAKEEKNR
ncbi:MAG: epoxyqueuosine reductase QueH [Lachnospiraceae bacterium]|nr:epoxyqueuosine reductase QueH [Lachnospiraceae bacterium]